ncbi:MAG: helix-turn-helix domain-containing protein [bacterium]
MSKGKNPLTTQILTIIRAVANNENITISEFARKAGISKSWISKLQNTDANLSLETATHLLDVVGYELVIKKKHKKNKIESRLIKNNGSSGNNGTRRNK